MRAWDYLRFTESLADCEGPQPCSPTEAARARAKGFGLSKVQLQAAGLSATGHALLNQSRRALKEPSGALFLLVSGVSCLWEVFNTIERQKRVFPGVGRCAGRSSNTEDSDLERTWVSIEPAR